MFLYPLFFFVISTYSKCKKGTVISSCRPFYQVFYIVPFFKYMITNLHDYKCTSQCPFVLCVSHKMALKQKNFHMIQVQQDFHLGILRKVI